MSKTYTFFVWPAPCVMRKAGSWAICVSGGLVAVSLLSACRSPASHREKADRAASEIVERKQEALFDRTEPFHIETPADTLRRRLLLDQQLPYAGAESLGVDQLPRPVHWPEREKRNDDPGSVDDARGPEDAGPLAIDLMRALEIGARHNREYQERKEDIFRAALNMDVEAFRFRHTLAGALEGGFTEDRTGEDDVRGWTMSSSLGLSRTLQTGAAMSSRIVFDLVKLLTLDRDSAYGLMADVSVTVPLLRGARRFVVTEPLTQADRNVMYAMYQFEQFKIRYAVRVASEYLQVLQQGDQVRNAEDNLERVAISASRARRLADAGRLPEIQVDQAQQEELRARDRWLSAKAGYERRVDQLKITLGLPTDAEVALNGGDLQRLTEESREERPRPLEDTLVPDAAIRLALEHRLDLAVAQGRVQDAQRAVAVAADALRPGADLSGTAQAGGRRGLGSASEGDARLNAGEGLYTASLAVDVPWSRTAERNAYRDSFIALERAVRSVQELEDQIKADVRNASRVLVQASESMMIQARSVELAQRRVDSTELFLQAGRAQIRDVLEAQEALVSARNAFTAAVVTYRLAELELQRDTGLLVVGADGLWVEYAAGDE